jgi:hypothetical protein
MRCRYQVCLALNYSSGRIILTRPCLSPSRTNQEAGISFPKSDFDEDMASDCLHAALSLISVFPEDPNVTWIYNKSPWWSTLHYIVQATTILLIHMSIESVPKGKVKTGEGPAGIADSPSLVPAACQKALRWLECFGDNDESSRRALKICNNFFRRFVSSKGPSDEAIPSTSFPTTPFAPARAYLQDPPLGAQSPGSQQRLRFEMSAPIPRTANIGI